MFSLLQTLVEMAVFSSKSYYHIFKAQADRLLNKKTYECQVSAAIQQKEINSLQAQLDFEKFFFVVNNHGFTTSHIHGVQKIMGYADNDFTTEQYLSTIHPSHLLAQMITAYEVNEHFLCGDWLPIFFKSHFFINIIALRHANGNYLLFKRLAYPFQYDDGNRLLAYLSEFTLIGPYHDEPYSARVTDASGNLVEIEKAIKRHTRKSFEKHLPFSGRELEVIHYYNQHENISNTMVAAALNVKPTSLKTFQKRIKRKAEDLFRREFKNTHEIALYLRKQEML